MAVFHLGDFDCSSGYWYISKRDLRIGRLGRTALFVNKAKLLRLLVNLKPGVVLFLLRLAVGFGGYLKVVNFPKLQDFGRECLGHYRDKQKQSNNQTA